MALQCADAGIIGDVLLFEADDEQLHVLARARMKGIEGKLDVLLHAGCVHDTESDRTGRQAEIALDAGPLHLRMRSEARAPMSVGNHTMEGVGAIVLAGEGALPSPLRVVDHCVCGFRPHFVEKDSLLVSEVVRRQVVLGSHNTHARLGEPIQCLTVAIEIRALPPLRPMHVEHVRVAQLARLLHQLRECGTVQQAALERLVEGRIVGVRVGGAGHP